MSWMKDDVPPMSNPIRLIWIAALCGSLFTACASPCNPDTNALDRTAPPMAVAEANFRDVHVAPGDRYETDWGVHYTESAGERFLWGAVFTELSDTAASCSTFPQYDWPTWKDMARGNGPTIDAQDTLSSDVRGTYFNIYIIVNSWTRAHGIQTYKLCRALPYEDGKNRVDEDIPVCTD